jgi:hypothetical protein
MYKARRKRTRGEEEDGAGDAGLVLAAHTTVSRIPTLAVRRAAGEGVGG